MHRFTILAFIDLDGGGVARRRIGRESEEEGVRDACRGGIVSVRLSRILLLAE